MSVLNFDVIENWMSNIIFKMIKKKVYRIVWQYCNCWSVNIFYQKYVDEE